MKTARDRVKHYLWFIKLFVMFFCFGEALVMLFHQSFVAELQITLIVGYWLMKVLQDTEDHPQRWVVRAVQEYWLATMCILTNKEAEYRRHAGLVDLYIRQERRFATTLAGGESRLKQDETGAVWIVGSSFCVGVIASLVHLMR